MQVSISLRAARTFACAAALVGIIASCARNPVSGKNELALVSESQEISMGQDAAKEVSASIGVVNDPALQSYVSGLGMQIARASERPQLPWSYTVVDDPAINAFALPGGPVFVTRGLLTHMTSEAELMSVLGHESGHITARHVVQQMSQQQLAQIGLIAAVIVKPELGQYANLATAGMQLMFLKFSRDDETQADALGYKYMVAQQYDPHEMSAMFRMLEHIEAATPGARVPQWQSTHPDPGNRLQATQNRIAQSPPVGATKIVHDPFVQHLDGMVYGEDPRQGFFRGASFLHPDLRFQFDFPSGWKTQNEASQVAGMSPNQDAIVVLTLAGNTAPQTALSQFINQNGMSTRGSSTQSINGLPAATAAFTANTQNGTLAGWVSFVNLDGTTMRLLGYTPSANIGTYDAALRNTVMSFRRLTDQSALNVRPSRIRLVRINMPMTVTAFANAWPSSVSPAEIALINGFDVNATMPAGTLVKRVVSDR